MSNDAAEQHIYAILTALTLGATWLVLWPSRYAFVSGRLWSAVAFALILVRPVLNVSALRPPIDEIGHRNSSWSQVTQIIDDTVGPRDTVLSMDNWDGASLLSFALRRNASRYVHPVGPYTRGYASDARWAEVLNDLRGKHAPKLIIINVLPLTAPPNGQRTVEWALRRFDDPWSPFPDLTAFPQREAFKAYIAANYRLDSCLADLCLLRPL